MNKKRITYMDMLKTVAMFLVVLYHSTLYSFNFLEEGGVISYIRYFFRTVLSSCVPLFFFANGYLLFGKSLDLRGHLLKMGKLIIQTLLWAVITLLILQVVHQEFFTPSEFVNAVWEWKDGWTNHLWYMGALICIYIFFPLMKTAYDHNRKVFFYFAIVCTILTIGNTTLNYVATILGKLISEKVIVYHEFNFFNIFNPLREIRGYTFVYFCAGGIAYSFRDALEELDAKKRNAFSIIGLLLSCFGLFSVGFLYSRLSGSLWDVVWNGYDSIFAFVNVLCIYLLCLNWKKDVRLVQWISSNTLGIYFIHGIIIVMLRRVIMQFSFATNILFNFLFAAVVILLSLMVSLFLKKCPIVCKLLK